MISLTDESKTFSRIAGYAAMGQLNAGRHFIAELPRETRSLELPEWRAVFTHKACVKRISVDTCMWATGTSRSKKRLDFVASTDVLLNGVKGYKCDGRHSHHDSHPSEPWPIALCREIMYAMSQVLIDYRRQMAYPIGVICQACKRNWTRVHPNHTRVPVECKFPNDVPMNMTCPACLQGKTRHEEGHTFDDGCRVPGMRDITRIGEEPARDIDRVPRVAESKDHVGKIPPRAPEPDSADAEPAPPTGSSSSSSTAPRPAPRKAADEQTRERVSCLLYTSPSPRDS